MKSNAPRLQVAAVIIRELFMAAATTISREGEPVCMSTTVTKKNCGYITVAT